MTELEQLKLLVDKTMPLGDEVWQDMADRWTPFAAKRKQVITSVGDTERYIYFVIDGVQRAYVDHKGKDATLVFTYTGSFSGVLDSFLLQQPSRYYLETITASKFIRLHYNDYIYLKDKHRGFQDMLYMALAHTLSGTFERHIELLAYSAEDKFTTLLRRSPQVLNMIPHKYLASYIGVDPATFSKLLSTVKL